MKVLFYAKHAKSLVYREGVIPFFPRVGDLIYCLDTNVLAPTRLTYQVRASAWDEGTKCAEVEVALVDWPESLGDEVPSIERQGFQLIKDEAGTAPHALPF